MKKQAVKAKITKPMSKTYEKAGVSIAAGEDTVKKITPAAKKTHHHLTRQNCTMLGGIGGFASTIEIPSSFKEPVLVSATDGVGSKLELAREHNALQNIGQDLVAMCVNDLLCAGAQPLYFLDYYACGHLHAETAATIINGISAACDQAGCALVGGETAEMPGIYQNNQFDLAGFTVGICEKSQLLPQAVAAGDSLIALASSGVHSNGFSLVRYLLEKNPTLAKTKVNDVPMIDALLEPTRLYCNIIQKVRQQFNIHGLAHITGGGLRDNISRIIPLSLNVDLKPIKLPPLFQVLQNAGNISDTEIQSVFNCGIGMVIVINADDTQNLLQFLNDNNETAWQIGTLTNGK